MKFGKSLSYQIEETLPEWRDKFLSYKELKKRLKSIEPKKNLSSPSRSAGDGEESAEPEAPRPSKKPRLDAVDGGGGEIAPAAGMAEMTEAEVDFVKLLEDELEKFNTFFVEKEEEYIIRLKELQDMLAKAKASSDEMINIWKEIVDFHGEMVLLENYSALNYTGLVKILKKHDKRTGALLRSPFIQKVLQQPFFTTDLLYKLVKECERMLDHLFPTNEASSATEAADVNEPSTSSNIKVDDSLLQGPKELSELEYMKSLYMKSTLSALRILKEIRSGSSTVSMFSLPPLQTAGLEEPWNTVPGPVIEEVAK